jgi:two-component system response regulator HydG
VDGSGDAKPERTERVPLDRETSGDEGRVATFRVSVVDGPDRGKEAIVGPESPAPLLVGTGPACGLPLTDRRVSRRHLSAVPEGSALRIQDLGSTNGTTVSSIRVADATLTGGELVRIGATTLRVDIMEESGAPKLWPVESFGRLVGASAAMRRLFPLAAKLAASTLPVIVEGETGTGKELFAESLHEMGPRKNHPFVVFDGASLESGRLEAVLFGEELRTGRPSEIRKGVFEEATGGTLLVDEIALLPLATQAKLSRVLERGEICRVGGDTWIPVDARVVATSRRNVDREVEGGRFREDLFFRLAAARVELPPLRQRAGDPALLAQRFWTQMAGDRPPPADLLAAYEAYAWPGNVRELRNLVARKVALGDLDQAPRAASDAAPVAEAAFDRVLDLDLPFPEARARVLAEFERTFIQRVLAKHGGNVSRAAAASGIARRYFQILRTRAR